MQTYVQGVKIVLTAEQQAAVEKELRKRARCGNNFIKLLKRFKFKQIDTTTWLDKNAIAFEHVYFDWFAQIHNHGGFSTVFMIGQGLKHGMFPGGWEYASTQEVEEELTRFMDNYNGE